ncbi:MAG: ATP-binding protein [Clostridia bacterium]|nr:ATP-binding protein [Clostridia bacterium]
MSLNGSNVSRVMNEFGEKRRHAESVADERKESLYLIFPELKAIDGELKSTAFKIFSESVKGREGLDKRINDLKEETQALVRKRQEILITAGLPKDFDSPHYECKRCSDIGYLKDGTMCDCFKNALKLIGYETSGMGKLISKQSFDNFSLDFYHGDDLAIMKDNLQRAKSYAESFDLENTHNMLFMGTTGLGKTHLSSSIAKSVIDKGYNVVYESSQNIFSAFEKEQFNKGEAVDTKKYFECDLLIIDDLGTEVTNQFTVSWLYNLINTRIINDKSMLISTNVKKEELLERYSDRIVSRLFGEFEICLFNGTDVRKQKLQRR